jgi:hypothetical protein
MKTKTIAVYGKDTDPSQGVSNEYPTSEMIPRQPCLLYVSATRNSGKSYAVSKLISQCQKEKIYDMIYIVTPTYLSNKSYFGKHIRDEKNDIFEPTKTCIDDVILRVEKDRDEFELYLEKKNTFDKLKTGVITIHNILDFYNDGFVDLEGKLIPPVWKYESFSKTIRAPQSCIILDDVIGSAALLRSSGIEKLCTLNRHVAPLKEPHKNRSACGLAVYILSQTYCTQGGLSRAVRENCTGLLLFKNKQEQQLDKIKTEMCSCVNESVFDKAYSEAIQKPYDNLYIDFNPKHPDMTFRKNLNQLLIFDETELG